MATCGVSASGGLGLDLASVPGAGLTSIGGGNGAACCWIAGGGAAFGGGAVLRVVGNNDNLELAALYLYRDWLPASGEEARLLDLLPAALLLPGGGGT